MHYHFSGIGGAGMNPLARLMAARGHQVQGSDRDFDRGRNQVVADLLRGAGITLLPQDGSAIAEGVERVIHSAAVEPTVPEMVRAHELAIETVPRPQLLAEVVGAGGPGVAIAGTSGKSTVTGMVAWILQRCGQAATVLGGAALAEAGANHMGCFAAAGEEHPVIAEACESDGSLVNYQPGLGLIHNITRDHREVDQLMPQFATFAANSQQLVINADDAACVTLAENHAHVTTYGSSEDVDVRLEIINVGPWRSTGQLTIEDREVVLDLPQPGQHTLENAVAAVTVALALGVPAHHAAEALREFPGVARRFQVIGTSDTGITVVDDYAHNGAKIAAAVTAAQAGCDRLVAVFQPHGYGPAKFLRDELRHLWPEILRPQDRICYAPIYDAGGTADRSIASAELATDLPGDLRCGYADDHTDVLRWVADQAQPGDTVLLMGARDPQLGDLAQAMYDLL